MCYTRRMQYVAGDPTKSFVAKWYFCAPTAKPIPFPTAFCSANWDEVWYKPTDLGDDATAKKTYSPGTLANISAGDSFAGPAAYFATGAPGPAFIPRYGDGTPVECVPVQIPHAGHHKGAQGIVLPTTVTVPCCTNPLPWIIHGLTANDFGSGCSCMAGITFALTWDPVNNWYAGSFSVSCGIGPQTVLVQLNCVSFLTGWLATIYIDGIEVDSDDANFDCSPIHGNMAGIPGANGCGTFNITWQP